MDYWVNKIKTEGIFTVITKGFRHLYRLWLNSAVRYIIFFKLHPFRKAVSRYYEYNDVDFDWMIHLISERICPVKRLSVDEVKYEKYVDDAGYRNNSYYQFGNNPSWRKKTLEHYITYKYFGLNQDSLVIDIASASSIFPEILEKHHINVYRQDLIYNSNLEKGIIGGNATDIPLEDEFATHLFLHCSFEHFEGNDDVDFIREAHRLLKPGGKLVVVPLYFLPEHTVFTDPRFSRDHIHFDKNASIVYLRKYNNRYGRHYSSAVFKKRILEVSDGFEFEIWHVDNVLDIDPKNIVHFVGVWTKI